MNAKSTPECGCKIVWGTLDRIIRYCPLHVLAPEMAEALKRPSCSSAKCGRCRRCTVLRKLGEGE